MKTKNRISIHRFMVIGLVLIVSYAGQAQQAGQTITRTDDPLPSWNDTKQKQAIVAFVQQVTKKGTPDYVAPEERIATFDNDGTLWSEQPLYFEDYFVFSQIRDLAPKHPDWINKEPYASVIRGDLPTALAAGEKAMMEMFVAAEAGLTTDELDKDVLHWITTAKHPTTKRLFTDMVFQPMLELLTYLRANGFKTYIVSGGDIGFMRPWTEKAYGIPPEQVIGTRITTKLDVRDGKPVIVNQSELEFLNNADGKALAIQAHIGRRPIASFGNSDGDIEMMQWTSAGSGPRLCLFVHHTDSTREWAYDRTSNVGRLDKGLDQARAKGWIVVDMKNDWKIIYPFEKK